MGLVYSIDIHVHCTYQTWDKYTVLIYMYMYISEMEQVHSIDIHVHVHVHIRHGTSIQY